MPKASYKRCRNCRRPSTEVGTLSHTRLCTECADALLVENVVGISEHRGPAFQRWRRAMAAAVGAVTLDDLEALVQDDADAR